MVWKLINPYFGSINIFNEHDIVNRYQTFTGIFDCIEERLRLTRFTSCNTAVAINNELRNSCKYHLLMSMTITHFFKPESICDMSCWYNLLGCEFRLFADIGSSCYYGNTDIKTQEVSNCKWSPLQQCV